VTFAASSGPPNGFTLSSRRHEVLRGTADTGFLRARGGSAAEPRQQPPVCSCVALGGGKTRLAPIILCPSANDLASLATWCRGAELAIQTLETTRRGECLAFPDLV